MGYNNAWGETNMCCFRTGVGTMEFHTDTDCYEKKASNDQTQSCADDATFRDQLDFQCHEWQGYNCRSAVTDYGYTPLGQSTLVEKCPSSCGGCAGNICRPKCSVQVSSAADCPDCEGTWTN